MRKAKPGAMAGSPLAAAGRVVIIEDGHEFGAAIRGLIEDMPGYEYEGTFSTMSEALAELRSAACELVFIEVRECGTLEPQTYKLTKHEARILKMLAQGHSYKSAALELEVSINTVSFHTRRIYNKLRVHSKSEAVAKALRQGLVH